MSSPRISDKITYRSVQTAITSVSFPENLELLRKMGTKWLGLVGKDWITDMDLLMDFPSGRGIPWIAPKWLTASDVLFFYHTKRAKHLIQKLLKESTRIISGDMNTSQVSVQDVKLLNAILRRQLILAESFAGSLFGFAEVSGRPHRAFDINKHFRGTIYAPLDTFYIFKKPLLAEEFADVLKIGQNTTTPMYGKQFEKIKNKLEMKNILPKSLKDTKPTSIGFRNVNSKNWIIVSCDNRARFINEAQLRTYLIDYLLEDVKDLRTPIHSECDCFRDGIRTGVVDYFIKFNDTWLPVEAKLNILAEENILGQLSKYIHIDSFKPTMNVFKEDHLQTSRFPFILVIDQSGVYLVKDNIFINCSPEFPLYKREELPTLKGNAEKKY